jgi:hypothetical protein
MTIDSQDFETAAMIERLFTSYPPYRRRTQRAESAPHRPREQSTLSQIYSLAAGDSVSLWGCPKQISEKVILECSATRYIAHAHIVYRLSDMSNTSVELHDRFSFLLAGSERAAKRYLTRRRLSEEFMYLECVVNCQEDSNQLFLTLNSALEMRNT